MREAWQLFSRVDEEYAFGETDDDGRRRLDQFVDEPTHRATIDFIPREKRVYFTRRDK
jgi:hypothetical protein